MVNRETLALDEALEFLNEGKISDKFWSIIGNGIAKAAENMYLLSMSKSQREKYKKEQADNKARKKEIEEKGYTEDQVKCYIDYIFKPAVEAYKSNTLIEYLEDSGSLDGLELYYLGINQSKFEQLVNKYIKDNPDSVNAWDLIDYMEELDASPEAIKFFENNDYLVVGDNGGGDHLLYFFKDKIFLEWDHECSFKDGQVDLNQKFTYQQLMNFAKMELTPKNGNSISDQFAKAAIAADAKLGYYRLSTPPAGVTPKKF